jgi:cellulose synthase/poly-beta-1,6-N-acetylglucosamine synthase-like glycosyltransferase/peptidoglycan/xylan/chitin deacetylase (PgdA/CDA1 family)
MARTGRHAAPGAITKVASAGRQAVPRPRVVMAALGLLVLVCVMLLDGYLHSEIGNDSRVHESGSAGHVPASVLDGGPVITFSADGEPNSHALPSRTIALTFDDGPDPEWTPKVLAVLREHHVPGTFFVVGQMAARYPGLIRDIVGSGSEIGVHTFSHVDLSYQSRARIDRELAQTQLALAGAAGITTSLFRAPYSSETDAIDNTTWRVYRYLGTKGYISAFVDTDSEDWRRPGVAKIVGNAAPRKGKGASVLFHDAGGDRSQTVEALGTYIDTMKAKGYTFTTLTASLGATTANHRATGPELWQGRALIWAVALAEFTMPVLFWLLVVVGVAVLARFAMMLLLARRHARIRGRRRFSWGPRVTEPVSVIVPAYNEKECIANTVGSLVSSGHPVEIVVVDDGSTDGTGDIVEAMGLPQVRVVRQENAGKPAALNHGLEYARHELVVMMDGDTVFEPDTVHRLVQPFADPRVGAVAGNAKVGNRTTIIGAWQHIEYVMGFNLDRRMYDLLGCMPTVPGAVGGFRRSALLQAGGMSGDTLAEDTDVTIALHRAGWRVVYVEQARAWTEAPGTIGQLWRQRYRWSYGTMQALWKHRRSLVDRGPSGRFGRVGMPLVVFFQIVTPLFAPLIDLLTLYGAVFVDPLKSVLAWAALLLVQLLCAGYAFRLDREKYRYLLMLPLQQIVYRQLMYLVLIHSCVTALTGGRLRWQKLERTGEVGAPQAPVGAAR